ncbi:MAG: M20/M25/M40 family metallo-hydrolase [Reinekea sp.]|nr:M20/M25/M40 family metallo-hydrolase [Reinekea sp.]
MRSIIPALALTAACITPMAFADDVWITIGTDGYESIKKYHPTLLGKTIEQPLVAQNNGVTVLKVRESDLSSISHLMHENHNRCGGFIAHDSLEAAQASVLNTFTLAEPATLISYSIDNPVVVSDLQGAMTESGIRSTISSLANFTNRYYATSHGVDAANWLKNNWQQKAAGRDDISVTLFNHSWVQPSVVMTIQGRTLPNEVVVIGAHLDSIISGGMSENTRAPGADDDASGIGTLTELINAITTTDFKPNRTLTLIGYAAEEVGLRGSKAIAENYKATGKNVVGVLQLDMTNYQGSSNDIYLIDDYTNAAQNNFVEQLVTTYQAELTVARSTCGYACSDHASWTNQGYPASFPFEATFNGANPYIHSVNDTLDKSGNNAFHALKFGKLAAAYVAELAKGNMSDTPPPDPDPSDEVTDVFNGSVSRNQEQSFGPLSVKANTMVSISMTGTNDADLYVRVGAAPTTSSYDCRPYKNGSNETCSVSVSGNDSDVYIMVRGYSSAVSTVSVSATYTPAKPDDGGDPDVPVTENFSDTVTRNQEIQYGPFAIQPSSKVVAAMTGTNDADLYVKFGSAPTTSSYDCRPYKNGSAETCDITAGGTDSTVYVMVRGYSSSASIYDLSVQYQP